MLRATHAQEVLVAQLCLTLCDPRDCGLPGSSVHDISQARMLEWVAISYPRGSSQPRDRTQVSSIGRWILCHLSEPWGGGVLLPLYGGANRGRGEVHAGPALSRATVYPQTHGRHY